MRILSDRSAATTAGAIQWGPPSVTEMGRLESSSKCLDERQHLRAQPGKGRDHGSTRSLPLSINTHVVFSPICIYLGLVAVFMLLTLTTKILRDNAGKRWQSRV